MTQSDTESVTEVQPSIGPEPQNSKKSDVSDQGSIYASSSVSGFTNSSLPRRKVIHVETATLYQLQTEVAKTSQHVDDIRAKFGSFKAPQVSRKLLPEYLKRKKKEEKSLKQNQGVADRNTRDLEDRQKERETADRIKRKLEAKSRLYDRVQKGDELDDYLKENCLVDFDGKEIDRGRAKDIRRQRSNSYHSEAEMIEHTDALGRTSYLTKNELSLQREKDKEISDLKRDDYDERYSRYSDGSRSPSPENKQARFQNLDDGDVRDLGVGYYNFSADENTRQQQMSLLDTLRHSTEQSRLDVQARESAKAEKTRRFLEKKRKLLAKKRGLKEDDIAIPETEVVIDVPAPKPLDRTEMNIDRNIETAKKASREWDKNKDMEEIYGEKTPVARETNYYETQRNKREDQFAPTYNDQPKQTYQKQVNNDTTFNQPDSTYNNYNNQDQQDHYGRNQSYGQKNTQHLSNQYGSYTQPQVSSSYGYGNQYGNYTGYGQWN